MTSYYTLIIYNRNLVSQLQLARYRQRNIQHKFYMYLILTTDICVSIFMVNMRTLLFSREKFSFLRGILPPLHYRTLIYPTIRYFRTCFVDDGHLCFKFYGKCEDFIWIKFAFLRSNVLLPHIMGHLYPHYYVMLFQSLFFLPRILDHEDTLDG